MSTACWPGAWRALALGAALALASLGAGAAPAAAYGRTAIWQIGLSLNCDNPALCTGQFGTGGFWGWIELDSGGAGDATLTGCSHLVAAGPVRVAGADHFNLEITGWTVLPGSAGPSTFFLTGGTVTFTGGTGGRPITAPLSVLGPLPLDTGVPAVAGHFSTAQLLGFTAPGVAFQIQVVKLPNR